MIIMQQLDKKDRKLLYFLDQNSRATAKSLSTKIGLSEQAVGYRIKRLQEIGVIKNFVTFLNTLALGYYHYKVFVKLENTTEQIEGEIFNFLVAQKNIRWVVSASGMYDVSFSVLARSPSEFAAVYRNFERAFGKYVSQKNIVVNISSPSFTREFLIGEAKSKKIDYKPTAQIVELDDLERRILKSISQDSRKSTVQIAQETNLTVDIVKYRIKKLEQCGVISSYTVQLDLEKLGYSYYSVFFWLRNFSPRLDQRVLSFVCFHSNIRWMVSVIGNYDLQFEIEVAQYSELEHIIKEFRQQFAHHVRDFEILRVTREYKYNFFPF